MAKKLYRSRTNRILGGVCGGIGEYFDVDANIVRILFLISGAGLMIYLIAWILIPEEPVRRKK
ncbi:MAG: PspC domain-containing protein [Candidatus Aenigmarchaeota archaeon]|nr:PspC domain-containing protein [Candidatus Aenigmarchaeota archaeon]